MPEDEPFPDDPFEEFALDVEEPEELPFERGAEYDPLLAFEREVFTFFFTTALPEFVFFDTGFGDAVRTDLFAVFSFV